MCKNVSVLALKMVYSCWPPTSFVVSNLRRVLARPIFQPHTTGHYSPQTTRLSAGAKRDLARRRLRPKMVASGVVGLETAAARLYGRVERLQLIIKLLAGARVRLTRLVSGWLHAAPTSSIRNGHLAFCHTNTHRRRRRARPQKLEANNLVQFGFPFLKDDDLQMCLLGRTCVCVSE
jgi:hypothetical protein